jgi:hypothetical protein
MLLDNHNLFNIEPSLLHGKFPILLGLNSAEQGSIAKSNMV